MKTFCCIVGGIFCENVAVVLCLVMLYLFDEKMWGRGEF